MESGHELRESIGNTHLMMQQEEAQSLEINQGQIEYKNVAKVLPLSTSEDGESFLCKYSQREFYDKEPDDLRSNEETAIQKVRLVQAKENGNIITRDLVLLSIWKNNDVALPVSSELTPGMTLNKIATRSKEPVTGRDDLQLRPMFQRTRASLLWVCSLAMIVVLIIAVLLTSMHIYSSPTHSAVTNSAVSSIPPIMPKIVPSATGKHPQHQRTQPSGTTTTTSPVSPPSDPPSPPGVSKPQNPVQGPPAPSRIPVPPVPGPLPPQTSVPQTPAPGPTPPPRKTPVTRTPAPGPTLFFGFDGSTQGWGTSEGQYKLAKVSDAHHIVYSGSGSLKVTTALIGNGSPLYPGNEVYTHTEATDYFSPHNLGGASGGATVTCYVYLPPGLAPGGTSPGYIRVFVKDTLYRNDFSDAVTIGPSTVGKWIKLSFVIGANSNNEDQGFDASQVSAIGVRVDLNNGSTLDYIGPFYIDACSL